MGGIDESKRHTGFSDMPSFLLCWCLRLFLLDALCKLLLLDHPPQLAIHFGMQFLVAAVIVILDAAGKTCEQCKDDEIECGVLIGL